jgi:hypothetical protein
MLTEGYLMGSIVISDVSGKIVYQSDVINSLRNLVIPIDKWLAGIYYVSLSVNRKVIQAKSLIISK